MIGVGFYGLMASTYMGIYVGFIGQEQVEESPKKPSGEDDPGALPVTELCSVTAVYPVDRLGTRSTGYTAPAVDRMGTRSTPFLVYAVDRVNCRKLIFWFFPL